MINGKFKSIVLAALVFIVAIGIAGVTLANDQSVQIIGFCGVVSTPLLILLSKLVENELAKQLEERNKEMRDALMQKLDAAEDKARETKHQVLDKVEEVKVAVAESPAMSGSQQDTSPIQVVIVPDPNKPLPVKETP